jgi:2-polyprenyl-3-methyl-5-hydroxy-6-metoxy-1,4-benzoquinol methylase
LSKQPRSKQRPARETNQAVLRQAMLRRLPRRLGASGQLELPCAPALADHLADTLQQVFTALGRVFDDDERTHLRGVLRSKLEEGFAASPYSRLVVQYQTDAPPRTSLSYQIQLVTSSVEAEYERWIKTRTPPYFGVHPDAKIVESARSLGPPASVPVLDVGAGSGRNTLPLAREGFPVDALELTPGLAAIIRTEAEKEQLNVRVFEGNALAGTIELPQAHYRVYCLAEVIASHIRTVADVRRLFEGAALALAPGGLLVFNAFLAKEGYRPDALAREISQVFWCNLYTRADMATAMQGLPFELVSDESTHDYEAEHQPKEGWPPTGWFVGWATGHDLFRIQPGRAPMELRWLVYRRT